jgi:hypothetical protein
MQEHSCVSKLTHCERLAPWSARQRCPEEKANDHGKDRRLEAEVAQIVGAEFIAQETGKLLVLFEERSACGG